ncbi:hypothetical protein BD310DRAFT_806323 [Dichomitus squalens]|uniref:BTB domain-containing protein n=1 Tax=Dichomitus squalens TaxID=114155 RepID=A0A4V2K9N2_9APHY|nr:hypothetical protein BD310DRAFT_806323 [Dichomitus squalens]
MDSSSTLGAPQRLSQKKLSKLARVARALEKAKANATPSDSDPAIPTVPLSTDQAMQDESLSPSEIHHAAILANITGRPYDDVKFFAFSRRSRNGSVDTPLSLVANSRLVLKAAPHFGLVFGAGFAESEVSDMDAAYPSSRPAATESYGYWSDSDLEDEGEDFTEDLSGQSIVDASSTSVQDRKMSESEPKGKDREESASTAEPARQLDSGQLPSESKKAIVRPGRVVHLDDVAYTTWKGFIFFAYFGELNFAPLKSQPGSLRMEPASHAAPLCSPKSMYRIAHKYDISSLREKAVADIKAKLSPSNILEEIFTTFTSLYPEVRDVEIEYLHSNITDRGIQARLPIWLTMLGKNELPSGASDIIASLISKLSVSPEPVKCPYGCYGTVRKYCNSGHYF